MTNLESYYQFYMEKYLGGTHKTLKVGVTDITTEKLHAELKIWKDWKNAVGQLKVYNAAANRSELHLYLFGKCYTKNKKDFIESILLNDIKPYEMCLTENGFDIIDLQNNSIIHSIINSDDVIDLTHTKMFKEEKYKSYNIIPADFMDEFNKLLNISDGQYPINLDDVANLLDSSKLLLTRTLKRSYIENTDYTIKNICNPNKISGKYTSNNYKEIMITRDCFKRLCMISRSKNADLFRKNINIISI